MRILLLAAVLALAPLAGCVDARIPATLTPSAAPGGLEDALAVLVHDHDHLDPAAHRAATGLTLLAHESLREDEPVTAGEIDVVGDLAVVAVLEPLGGFVTLDVSDPARPTVLGRYTSGVGYAGDVKLSPDGTVAFLAMNGPDAYRELEKSPALAPTLARASGVEVVDVSDPAAPRLLSFHALPTGGAHMVDVHVIDGETYVVSVVRSHVDLPAKPPASPIRPEATSRVEIARLEDAPGGKRLVHVADYVPDIARKGPGQLHLGHDVTVYDDPEDGPVLLVAYARAGIAVASLRDPANPQTLGEWTGHDGAYVHTVMPFFADGKRVLVATPEDYNGEEQSALWFLDATDWGDLSTIARWKVPGFLPFEKGYLFSTHNVNVLDGKLYLAHYHAGVWVLDVSAYDELQDPPVLGYHFPVADGLEPSNALGFPAAPMVWDALPAKGVVFATDLAFGLYALEPAWTIPPDALPYGTRGA